MHSPEVYNARWLRNNMTETERRVWSRLRTRQLGGYKFRRQVPVSPYVVDFMCVSDRFAVEVDGAGHEDEEKDEQDHMAARTRLSRTADTCERYR